jgi:WD40 repeat protein
MGYMKKQLIALAFLIMGCQVFAQTVITKPKFIYPGHSDLVEGVAFSPDGKYLFSTSWDKNVHMYSADSVWLIKKIGGHNAAITQIAFSRPRNKPMLIATASKDFSVKGWDSTGMLKYDFVGYNTAVTAIAFDFAAKNLYTGSAEQGLNMYDLATGEKKRNMMLPNINAIACAKDGQVFIGTNDPAITIIKFPAAAPTGTLVGHSGPINALEISYSGKYLVSGSSDKTAIVWEAATKKQIAVLKGHTWKVTCIAISRDEKYVVTGSNDGTAKVWELTTGKLLYSYEGYGYNVRSVAISPDNSKIAVASYERNTTNHGVRVYDSGLVAPTSVPLPEPEKGGTLTSDSLLALPERKVPAIKPKGH